MSLSALPTEAAGKNDVCAVIVTFRPEIGMLRKVVTSVKDQVEQLLIFDNGTDAPELSAYLSEVEVASTSVIRSPTNVGLATAMNRAADYARQNGFGYLLLLDQDSQPHSVMVSTLKTALLELNQTEPTAAVGPQFRDRRTGYIAPFVKVGFPISRKIAGGPGQRIKCDFLISSGTLLPLSSLDRVGPMDESLFIDNVDLEWCFRAQYRGMALYGICDAQMQHSIGDAVRPSRLVSGGIKIHSPTRLYYIMRNRVLLYGRKETPIIWIAQDIPRLLLKFIGTIIFLSPRLQYLRSMTAGLHDAWTQKTGSR